MSTANNTHGVGTMADALVLAGQFVIGMLVVLVSAVAFMGMISALAFVLVGY